MPISMLEAVRKSQRSGLIVQKAGWGAAGGGWEEGKHPRGYHGKWIGSGGGALLSVRGGSLELGTVRRTGDGAYHAASRTAGGSRSFSNARDAVAHLVARGGKPKDAHYAHADSVMRGAGLGHAREDQDGDDSDGDAPGPVGKNAGQDAWRNAWEHETRGYHGEWSGGGRAVGSNELGPLELTRPQQDTLDRLATVHGRVHVGLTSAHGPRGTREMSTPDGTAHHVAPNGAVVHTGLASTSINWRQ